MVGIQVFFYVILILPFIIFWYLNNNDKYGTQGGTNVEAGGKIELPSGLERAGKV